MSLSWFAFHPPLQVLAIGLFSYGILTLQPTNQPKTKAAGLTRHQLYMFLIGTPSILAGTWVIYHNKNINGRAHFTSWHGVSVCATRPTFLLCLIAVSPASSLASSPYFGSSGRFLLALAVSGSVAPCLAEECRQRAFGNITGKVSRSLIAAGNSAPIKKAGRRDTSFIPVFFLCCIWEGLGHHSPPATAVISCASLHTAWRRSLP